MESVFKYQSDDYDRESQRFVIPLYYKDELGNYLFSSTVTLVEYKDHHYFIFAAHALPDNESIDNFFIFHADGEFSKVIDMSIGYKIFKSQDIVIIDCFNRRLESKNYFDLNENSMLGFDKKHFAWTGFPSSKCKTKTIHNTKSPETLKNKFVHEDDSGVYFKSASYYTIISKVTTNNKVFITGSYERKNATLKYKGDVSMASHPEGMSGGAMYFFAKNQKLQQSLAATFRFAGIGIEYRKDNSIIGVAKAKIIELLDLFDKENPVQFFLHTDHVVPQT